MKECCERAKSLGHQRCGRCRAWLSAERFAAYGRPNLALRVDANVRFDRSYTVDAATGCWVWSLSLDTSGYGRLRIDGRQLSSHRFAYQRFVGPISDGMQLDHLCRNRACCNPAHLEQVTLHENIRRGGPATKVDCANGHPLSGDNLVIRTSGKRACRICSNRSKLEYKIRKRAEAA